MFLKRLYLKNVRSLRELELLFTTPDDIRKWTMLLGENGVGKSTVLRALALLLAGSEALPELIGEPSTWIHMGNPECLIQADIITAKKEARAIELRIHRNDKVKDVFERNKQTLDDIDKAIAHSARNYLTIGYGVSRRLSSDNSLSSKSSGGMRNVRAQSVATMFSSDATLNPLESWAMDLHYRRGRQGLEIVKKALTHLLPGVEFEGIDKDERKLIFRTPDGRIPLSLLSDGYQNVAAWCGDLLYRITEIYSNFKDPFSARGLLLIDELDLHLHPLWKRQLVNFLNEKLPNFQIIATTHSALTAHQTGAGELFVLRREHPDSPPSLYQYPGAAHNLMLHQLLLSPVFGLSTVDSKQVETLRSEYKNLRAKPKSKLNTTEKTRLKELRDELENLPDWTFNTPQEKKQRLLLNEIHQALQSNGSAKSK
jgi:hypothetical protein